MRTLIQRVLSGKVVVGGQVISEIGPGLAVLVGCAQGDTHGDAEYMLQQVLHHTKAFPPTSQGGSRRSVVEYGGDLLFISQFTLYGKPKGNKIDFHNAMAGEKAKIMYEDFVRAAGEAYKKERVKDGQFAAFMEVSLVNDGGFFLELDSTQQHQQPT